MPTRLVDTANLTAAQREQMFALLAANFEGLDRQAFAADLAEKPWVFLVTDKADPSRVAGFSTLMPLETEIDGRHAVALFSGDTVLDEARWGDRTFVRCVIRELTRLAQQWPGEPVYWLLLTCTYRSYRYLPAFAKQYYPRAGAEPPPADRRAIEALVRLKFPREFRAATGVVALERPTPFRAGRGEIDAQHLADPHVAYFAAANPGYLRGDFLVCWADVALANLTSLALRLRERFEPN